MHPSSGALPYISLQSCGHYDHIVTFNSSECFRMHLEWARGEWKSKIKWEASSIVMITINWASFHSYVTIKIPLFLKLHCKLVYSDCFNKRVGFCFSNCGKEFFKKTSVEKL
jgi:hypothetical protein